MEGLLFLSLCFNVWLFTVLLLSYYAEETYAASFQQLLDGDEKNAKRFNRRAFRLFKLAYLMSFGLLHEEDVYMAKEAEKADDVKQVILTFLPITYLTDEELEALKNDRDTFLMAPRCFFSQERLEKLEEIAGEMLKRRFGV